jgi:GalNAc-alpha-(1->4)-GalNAc-alpha-(1->3)-diNAcBac-PP-undecaprenol alpha-1,4-N-acetyl-D-galactosaminyltransferase
MEGKRIVIVNFNLNSGGTQRYISVLANNLSKEGYQITLLLLKKDEIFYNLDSFIRIIQPDTNYKDSKIEKCFYFINLIFFLRKNILKAKPILVINAAFPFFFMLSTFGIKIPIVTTIRCDPCKTSLIEGISIPHLFRKLVYNIRSTAIIAQTSYAAKILSMQFKAIKIVTIPNFLDQVTIMERTRDNIVISAGRLKKSKGFNYLIRAFKQVDPHNWKLLILGEGPEKQSLQNLINLLEMKEKIVILDYQRNIQEYFAMSKVFAFTSLSEGFPNVLLEAMATPLACISFDIDAGPRDMIIEGKNGFLIESKNISEFATKLRLLIQDNGLRENLMEEAVKVRETYSWNKIRAKYIDLIQSLGN